MSRQNTFSNIHLGEHATAHFGDVNYMGHNLPALERQTGLERKELLTALAFDSMNAQQVRLAQSVPTSLDWIWLDKWQSGPGFVEWLVDETPVFWITGKPGSGKSTLVNFLCSSRKVKALLGQRSSHDWFILDFYFDFREGTQIANTLEGLLRSILHQFIRKSPTAAQAVEKHAYGSDLHIQNHAIDLKTLCSLIQVVTSAISATHCILIFVDGLDEFSGSYLHLVRMIEQLGASGVHKICLASRPEHLLHQFLIHKPNFEMHVYNRPTIRAHITQTIDQASSLVDLVIETQSLVHRVVDLSDGVILWTRIVSESLLDSLLSGDTEQELLERLSEIPKELQEAYDYMLGRVQVSRQIETALILHLLQTSIITPSPTDLHCLLAFMRVTKQLPCWPKQRLDDKSFLLRLRSRTGSMIDIIPDQDIGRLNYHPSFDRRRVVLFHKTFADHLQDSKWMRDILRTASPPIEPRHLWLRACSQALESSTLSSEAVLRLWDLLESTTFEDPSFVEDLKMAFASVELLSKTITIAQDFLASATISGSSFLIFAIWQFPHYLGNAWDNLASDRLYFLEILGSPIMLLHLMVHHLHSEVMNPVLCKCHRFHHSENPKKRLFSYSTYQRAALLALGHEQLLCAEYVMSRKGVAVSPQFCQDILRVIMINFQTSSPELIRIQKPRVLALVGSVARHACDELVALRLYEKGGSYDAEILELVAPYLSFNSGDRTLYGWQVTSSAYMLPTVLVLHEHNLYLAWLFKDFYCGEEVYELRGHDREKVLPIIASSGLDPNEPCSILGSPLHTFVELSLTEHIRQYPSIGTLGQLRCLLSNGANPKTLHEGLNVVELAKKRITELKAGTYSIPYLDEYESGIYRTQSARKQMLLDKLSEIVELLENAATD